MLGPQTPRPPAPPAQHEVKKNPLGYIIRNWRDFMAKAQAGVMDPNIAKSIRTILGTRAREAILQGFLVQKMNIFLNMSPILDPRVQHEGTPTLSHEQYVRENALAIEDLKTMSKERIAAQAGSSVGTGTSTGTGTPIQQNSSPVGTPQPQPQVQAQTQTQPQTGSANPTATIPARPTPQATNATVPHTTGRPPIRPTPLPEGMMSLQDVRRILQLGDSQRQMAYARTPGLKAKYDVALAHYQALSAKNAEAARAAAAAGGAGAGNARPPNSAPSSGPSTPSSSQNQPISNHTQNQVQSQARPPPPSTQQTPARPPPTNIHAGTPTPNPNPAQSIPSKPFNLNLPPQRQAPPMPPQPPPENEKSRRKRKFREYLREEAPGLEVEVGVDQIVSDYIDAFVDEAARGAIRLTKHRKSNKIELKDIALFLDVTHDMRLPGFNVQLPQRQHVSADTERKRGKAVAPRAARKAKDAE